MKFENEITVSVKTDCKTLENELKKNNFIKHEEYIVNDIYMISKDINISNMKTLDILKKCILVRNIEGIETKLIYKYKEYSDNGDILKQSKIECPVTNINSAINFMKAINYKELIKIHDKCSVFANKKTELIVQLVNDKYLFIEMESIGNYLDKKYLNIEEIRNELLSYNLPIDKTNIFVKKAEIILNETLNRKQN